MADKSLIIPVETLKPELTNPSRIDGGGNWFYVLFDDTVAQGGRIPRFRLPVDFASNPRLILQFSPKDTQAGTLTVKWNVSVMASVMDAAADWDSDSFGTANNGSKTLALNHGAGNPTELIMSLTNFDSGSGGDAIGIKIVIDVTGTAVGDIELGTLTFLYADS